jgi:hypothetical protein
MCGGNSRDQGYRQDPILPFLFIHCPTTWSVVGWGIIIAVVVMAINANRST